MDDAPLDMLIFMKIYMAEHGDGVYLPEEDREIHRIATEVGICHGFDANEVHVVAKGMLDWYQDTKNNGDKALADRFNLATARIGAFVKDKPGCPQNVCDFLLSVARADRKLTNGEIAILHGVQDAWDLPRSELTGEAYSMDAR